MIATKQKDAILAYIKKVTEGSLTFYDSLGDIAEQFNESTTDLATLLNEFQANGLIKFTINKGDYFSVDIIV